MTIVQERLFSLQDKEYASFQGELVPCIPAEKIIGVRVPELRRLAKEIIKNGDANPFTDSLPHDYYDENMLHALIISETKEIEECLQQIERFLPYVDNWAVCDSITPKAFKNHIETVKTTARGWTMSKHTYTCRFGVKALMTYCLDDNCDIDVITIESDEYYVNMMKAWYFATALARRWEKTLPVIENKMLDKWVHNKTIQKACESYRITQEQKTVLKALRIK